MTPTIKKSFTPILKVSASHKIAFDNALHRPHAGHMSILSSTIFNFKGYDSCRFIDKDGIIMIERSGLGNQSYDSQIVHHNIGSVDYTTGMVHINSFRPLSIQDGSNRIYITTVPKGNTILNINASDITVTMINDTDLIESKKVQGY